MTSRERLLALLGGEIPDCVPVCPDISNMVPCRLTGKPFWDIYAYEDPPLWKAHIDALKYFDIDGGFELYQFGPVDVLTGERDLSEKYVVHRYEDGRFVVQNYRPDSDTWAGTVAVYTKDNPPASNVAPGKIGLPDIPKDPERLTGVKSWPVGMERWLLMRKELGDQGIMGLNSGMGTNMMGSVEAVYAYHDNPKPFFERAEKMIADVKKRMELLAASDLKPDFLLCGGSGTLVFQSPEIFRELVLPVLKITTQLAYDLGIPTHVHSCGPERELVKIVAEETHLSVIDPLEIPPMGDCDLSELKRFYGDKIILKGNLHTTEVMLNGTRDDVIEASKQAIDDGAAGGGFILSTGDQCGRDTPDENLRAMVETARTYGKY